MTAATPVVMDVEQRAALPYPRSLPEFQRLFPDDPAAAYLEKARWESGFVCPRCDANGEPFRIASRPGVLTCRKCRSQTGLTVGTVMKRSRTPLSVWFWAAYLVASQTPGISAVQLQRQLGLSRYETAGALAFSRTGCREPSGLENIDALIDASCRRSAPGFAGQTLPARTVNRGTEELSPCDHSLASIHTVRQRKSRRCIRGCPQLALS